MCCVNKRFKVLRLSQLRIGNLTLRGFHTTDGSAFYRTVVYISPTHQDSVVTDGVPGYLDRNNVIVLIAVRAVPGGLAVVQARWTKRQTRQSRGRNQGYSRK